MSDPPAAQPRADAAPMSGERIDDLRAQAEYARQRYELYKAKAYGMRPTSTVRMRELERTWERAQARLAAALDESRPPADG
jgi:hypothetical protein